MAAAGRSTGQRQLVNALYALVTPLGVVLFYAAADRLSDAAQGWARCWGSRPARLSASPPAIYCPSCNSTATIARRCRWRLIAGIALAWSTVFLEGSGHDHHHQHEMDAAPHEHHDHD